jgi:ABC-2 type transport system permease protein
MLPIFKKEINAFFSSLIGYIVIGVFLVLMGLLLWVFPEFSILDGAYANLDTLFAVHRPHGVHVPDSGRHHAQFC